MKDNGVKLSQQKNNYHKECEKVRNKLLNFLMGRTIQSIQKAGYQRPDQKKVKKAILKEIFQLDKEILEETLNEFK